MPNGLNLGFFAVVLAFGMNTLLMGVRSVLLVPERKRQFAEPPPHAVRFDIREVLAVHTRCALVGAALGPGVRQDVLAADLVVQRVQAIAGFSLRFRVQRHLPFLNTLRS